MALLRGLLGLIGLGCAFMAGSTLERKGPAKAGRHYAWMARAVVCLAVLGFRHVPDAWLMTVWALAAAAFAGGWWQAAHRKPPEDLSQDIIPRDE
jgi:hypothetical protein